MYKGKPIFLPILVVLALIGYGAWYLLRGDNDPNAALKASGTIEVIEVSVAPEVSGKVTEVLAAEGGTVEIGEALFRLEDELLAAQRQKAQAALQAAQMTRQAAAEALQSAQAGRDLAAAQLEAAQASLDLAILQQQRTLNAARLADLPSRVAAWRISQPDEVSLPAWYFQKADSLSAAQALLDEAMEILEAEQANLANTLDEMGGETLAEAERRLAEAEQSFWVAQQVLEQAKTALEGADLQDAAQERYDTAEAWLTSAQEQYDSLLSEDQRKDLRAARARLAVAQEAFKVAQDRLSQLQTGDQSLEVQIAGASRRQAEANLSQAQAGLQRAEAAISQAEASLAQAEAQVAQVQAELGLIDLQLERYEVSAPVSGAVLVRSVEPGEVLQAGAVAFTLGNLQDLTITVYLPEDRYGEVSLADEATVAVDSFPGRLFSARVRRIADRAEFTPRNVQTQEGRKTTYFAVALSLDNREGLLKPGMPADVVFP